MNKKTYFWGVLDHLLGFLSTVSIVLVNVYLWQESKSLEVILEYNLVNFIAALISIVVLAFIGTILGVKIIYIFARLFQTSVLVLLAIVGDEIYEYLMILGILQGVASSGLNIAKTVISQLVVADLEQLKKLYSLQSVLVAVFSLFVSLVVNFMLTQFDIQEITVLIASIIIFLVSFLTFVKIGSLKQNFALLGFWM